MTPFVGQIQSFGFNFAPRGWARCDGQLLPVSGNDALFSLLGTIYGGDGRSTFGLPDLRGRVSLQFGKGPGLPTNFRIGQKGGQETVTLISSQIPSHNHSAKVVAESPDVAKPEGALIATPAASIYSNFSAPDATLKSSTIGNTGGGQPHNNMQPSLTINWCIALVGVYPSRS